MNLIERGGEKFNITLLALFLGSFVTFADLYSTQPVIPLITEHFHVTPAVASLSLSFSTGTMAIGLVVVSLFTNGFNKKKVMGISLTLSAILCLAVGLVESMPFLLVLRALQGAAMAGFPAIAMAYITEEFHPKSLGYVMGIYVAGNSLGGLAGRMIVGTLSEYISWTIAIALLGLLSLVISILFWLMLPDSTINQPRSSFSIKGTFKSLIHCLIQKDLFILYILAFVMMGSFVSIYNYIGIPLMKPPYNLSQVVISFIFVVYLVGTFSSAWMGQLADRLQRKWVMLVGVALTLVGALLTLLPFLLPKIVGLIILTFGFFGAHSIASSWVGILAHRNEKAYATSLYLFAYYAGSSVIGALGGVFFHRSGWFGEISMVTFLLSMGIIAVLTIKNKEN